MDNFITVKVFTYPSELAIIRGRLESEGIECRVQDELTVQVDPFYSNAIGGLKLQVRQSNVEETLEILKEGGYSLDEAPPFSKFYLNLDKTTSKIPLIKKFRFEFRLLIIIGLAASVLLGILYYLTLPT